MAAYICRRLPAVLLFACAACAQPSFAEVWGYVDADGTAHVATEKLDERYQLFFKGPTNTDVGSRGANADLDALRATSIYKRMVDHPNIVRYQALIDKNARARGIDAALVKAVIAVESAFEPASISTKGALGLMQVTPDTGARYGVTADRKRTLEQKLLDPDINLRIGTTYLRDLLRLYGNDVALALAAYNAGEQAVAHYANRIPPYPETQEYVKLVQQFYELYRPASPAKPVRILVPSRRSPS
jgi:soluble lytic murein transglycosylase-like protein